MTKKEVVIIADYSQTTPLTLGELCDICHITTDVVQHFVEHDIVQPHNISGEWGFDLVQLQRLKKAIRLQHDLEVNLAGVALALDLLDQIQTLHEKMVLLEKHR